MALPLCTAIPIVRRAHASQSIKRTKARGHGARAVLCFVEFGARAFAHPTATDYSLSLTA